VRIEKAPKFKNEKEFKFWSTHDSTDYVDYSKGKEFYSQPEAFDKDVSIRLPESLIEHLKVLANKRDVPYQSLLKMF
jgi:predicted DNA binding CopG/RHH family protein